MHDVDPEYRPVNATLILSLGVASVTCLPFVGPVAWSMGTKALRAIDRGEVDPAHRQNVAAGRICGMVGTAILVIAILGGVALAALEVFWLDKPATVTLLQ